MSGTPQGSFIGSQPDWEEPGGIMDSITGIIPRNVPVRATSFTGLLAINDDDSYQNSGPPTPYDNNESPPDEVPPNIGAIPTFSFLNIDLEQEKRRNINLSKFWAINPLVSFPPSTAASHISIGNNTSTTTTTTQSISNNNVTETSDNYYKSNNSNNNNNNQSNDDEGEEEEEEEEDADNKDEDENELLSPHSSPPVKAQTTPTATPASPKRKRGPYNTRNRQLAAAQALVQVDDESFGIQPRSKRKRVVEAASDVEVPSSEPDPASSAPPPSRKARGGATTSKRGRGARNVSTNVGSPTPSSPPSSASPPSNVTSLITSPSSSSSPLSPSYKAAPANVITSPIAHTSVVPSGANRPPSPPNPAIIAGQIKNLEAKLATHQRQVNDLRTHQGTALTDRPDYKDLMRTHERTSAGVRATHCDADQLLRSTVMEPNDVSRVKYVRETLAALLVRLKVLWREVALYSGTASSSDTCHGALIIREQSPPRVLFKQKDMGKFCVELVTPTNIKCEILTAVTVGLCSTSDNKKDITNIKALANSSPLTGHSQEVDNHMMAIFEQLKLTTSTRMICSNLRFHVSMKTTGPGERGKLIEIESEPSFPFIGITNESQWPEAAGKLLYSDAFDGNKIETSWAYYANMLQMHFMTITGQNIDSPTRKLYPWELRYIHSRFGNRALLSKDATEKFWNFFGQVMLNIHFKRKIYEMWRDGLIYGLITKDECTSVLSKHKEGTFLIRFSESIPGAFAIAHVNASSNAQERVRHFLVRSDSLGSNKTLPDYLKDQGQFQTILKLDPLTRALEAIPKDEALELLYSKKPQQTAPGYILC